MGLPGGLAGVEAGLRDSDWAVYGVEELGHMRRVLATGAVR
ncbi:hypothetical protein [Dactylosporangium cerinum]